MKGLNNPDLDAAVGGRLAQQLRDELELVQGASNEFDKDLFLGRGNHPGLLRNRVR